jgi:signal transduction histidine kinase
MQMSAKTVDSKASRKGASGHRESGPDSGIRRRGEARRDRSGVRAAYVERGLDQRMAQMREANEHLVVACTRAQQLVEEAERTDRLKDEFLATVSHEFRTPLNAVLGWARILESKQLPRGRAEHAIAAIGRNASALAHMVDDLLDTSRIVRGSIRLALQPVDLAAVRMRPSTPFAPGGDQERAARVRGRARRRTVSGDADRLQQVIWNLLSNAVKFTPDGGRVDVFIESLNDHMEVRVSTRAGASVRTSCHTYSSASAKPTTRQRRRHTGLGLGLGIVRQLVELHGGTVRRPVPAWDRVRRSPCPPPCGGRRRQGR